MGLIKLMIANLWKKILERLKREIDFFRKKPAELLGVNKLAEATFDTFKKKLKDLILQNAQAIMLLGMDKLLNDIFSQRKININDPSKEIDILSDKVVLEYCARSPHVRKILDSVGNSLNDDIAGEIANLCGKSNLAKAEMDSLMGKLGIEDINGNDLIKSINSNSDFNDRTDLGSLDADQKSLLDSIWEILPYIMLVLYLIIRSEEFLKQNEYRSRFRGKYLTKLVSSVTAMIKETINKEIISPAKKGYSQLSTAYRTTRDQLENIEAPEFNMPSLSKEGLDFLKSISGPMLSGLKLMDAAIGAIMMATTMYILNRIQLQNMSLEDAKRNLSSDKVLECDRVQFPEPFLENPNINSTNRIDVPGSIISNTITIPEFINPSFRCPVETDDELTPSEPIGDEIGPPSCPIPLDIPEEPIGEPELQFSEPGLAKFRFINTSKLSKIPSIKMEVGQLVYPNDIVFSFGREKNEGPFTSPIYGKVIEIDKGNLEIILEKYPVPDSTPSEEKTFADLAKLYSEKSEVEEFIKNFYVESYLPVLLNASPTKGSVLSSSQWANIIYRSGGIAQHWKTLKNLKKSIDSSFDNAVKNTASPSRIKSLVSRSEGNTEIILSDLTKLKTNYYKNIENISEVAYNRSKVTSSKREEYVLSSYYFQLWNSIIDYENNTETIQYKIDTSPNERDKNRTLSSYRDIIAEILLYRIPYDKFSSDKVKEKINSLCKSLSDFGSGSLRGFGSPPNYFKEMDRIFSEYMDKNHSNINRGASYILSASSFFPQSKIESAQEISDPNKIGLTPEQSREIFGGGVNALGSYVKSLGQLNKELSDEEKNSIIYQVISLYFLIKASSYSKLPDSSLSIYKITESESNKINSFIEYQMKRLSEIDLEISEKLKSLDILGRELSPMGSEVKEGEEYSIYIGSLKRTCPIPSEERDYLTAISEYEFKDIQYWRRYMNFATLSSVLSGTWGTGILPPAGPIPLPTVYVPIKAWQKEWGIIVMGLTITGIYFFPFLMVANLSLNPQVAFGNPAGSLKNEIKSTKLELLQKTENMKRGILKPMIDELYKKIKSLQSERIRVSYQIVENNFKRPEASKYKDPNDKLKNAKLKIQYVKDFEKWTVLSISLRERKFTIGLEIFRETVKYQALKRIFKGTQSAKNFLFPQFKPIEILENSIKSVFGRLEKIAEKIDAFIAKLPIATLAGSANFGPTIKNPKPITQIDRGIIDDLVDQNYLDNLMKSFEPKKEWLMSSKFGALASKSFVNNKKVKEALALATIVLVPKDPFPKYENLKISNVGWFVRFLLPKWAPAGGGQFGFPGFPVYPKK